MLSLILKALNDNHWFIVAAALISILFFYGYGCESQTNSLINPEKKVTRGELQAELEYLASIADVRIADLDKRDAIKQELLDAANVIGTGGTINASGLVNLAATIGAISFGLNRNQQLKNTLKNKTANDSTTNQT
jgi:hypothetical protein